MMQFSIPDPDGTLLKPLVDAPGFRQTKISLVGVNAQSRYGPGKIPHKSPRFKIKDIAFADKKWTFDVESTDLERFRRVWSEGKCKIGGKEQIIGQYWLMAFCPHCDDGFLLPPKKRPRSPLVEDSTSGVCVNSKCRRTVPGKQISGTATKKRALSMLQMHCEGKTMNTRVCVILPDPIPKPELSNSSQSPNVNLEMLSFNADVVRKKSLKLLTPKEQDKLKRYQYHAAPTASNTTIRIAGKTGKIRSDDKLNDALSALISLRHPRIQHSTYIPTTST